MIMKIKKMLAILLTAAVTIGCLTACGTGEGSTEELSDSGNKTVNQDGGMDSDVSGEKLSIVTTIFPEYDWVREIMGDQLANADVTMLLDNGVDLHSYQPTAADILKISECDLFIYVGGESDAWVEDVLKEASNPDMKIIDLLDTLGGSVKEEEVVEGM